MKPMKPKTKKAKPTRGKSEPLPPREYFTHGSSKMARHLPVTPLFRLAVEHRPKLTPAELAALIGTLNLPKTREGAGEALRLVWECAQVLAEERADLAEHDKWREREEIKHADLVKLIGFDPDAEKYPMPHKRFMALLNSQCRDGVVVRGVKLRGAGLFRAFLFGWLGHEFVTTEKGMECREVEDADERVNKFLRRVETDHWPNSLFVPHIHREFAYWRDRLARENMKRTKGNLLRGEEKKRAVRRRKPLAHPRGE